MLYKDDLDTWKIAEDDEHEAELRKDGYQSHDEIVNPKPKPLPKLLLRWKPMTPQAGH